MADYTLSYSASDINQRLGKITELETNISELSTQKVTAPATAQIGQTIVVKAVDESGKPTEWEAVDMTSGGDTAAIIDVVELPTENIDEDMFYRKLSGSLVYNQRVQNTYIINCVDTLPETGEPAVSGDLSGGLETATITAYYSVLDQSASAYADNVTASIFGIPVGWYPLETFIVAAGFRYGGVITNILDDPLDDTLRLLLEYVVYDYKNGNWTSHKKIGWAGTGQSAEIFNFPRNVASGDLSHAEGLSTNANGDYSHAEGFTTTAGGSYSHAEGLSTTATGNASHAEGHNTKAIGSQSHAEGLSTNANGDYSHAEGFTTTAGGSCSHAEGNSTAATGECSHAEGTSTAATGNYSHAEGYATTASRYASHAEGFTTTAGGSCSHAEGEGVIASGEYQHVQGKYNVEDTENKYAHIVGNGEGNNNRSNAHTLDWDGNAWFAGGIELTSPNGTRYRFTVSDDGTLSAVAI